MRRLAPIVLLLGPAVLAFASGGYFTGARLVALVVAFVTLALALATADRHDLHDLARDTAVRAALGGLALLAAWTWVSASWAPLEAPAIDARERTALYLATITAAALVFGDRTLARWVEPALAAGIVVVLGYGVLGELGVLDLESTISAGGRLDQPLTYWNAEGALAAMGLVLCARLAGSSTRERALRVAGAAAIPLLGLGVYATFSRGALTACVVGLAVLLACTTTWTQLRALAIGLEGAVVAVVAYEAASDGVTLAVLVAACAATAAGQALTASAEDAETTPTGPLPHAPRLRTAAWLAAAAFAAAPFAIGVLDRDDNSTNPAFGATTERLASSGSHRYAYWRVALETFADKPTGGVGAGGFQAAWLERRTIDEPVRDAHSLELETLAELGIVGFVFLLVFLGGVVAATRRAAQLDPALIAGPAAALAVYGAHSAIDWDWELPALTLVAAVLAGMVLARGYHRALA